MQEIITGLRDHMCSSWRILGQIAIYPERLSVTRDGLIGLSNTEDDSHQEYTIAGRDYSLIICCY